MKHPGRSHAFTLTEVMIAMTASIVVLGALLLSSTQLQRALYASERLATAQSNQRRLMDYVARDLRRAVGIGSATTMNGADCVPLLDASAAIENGCSLVVTLPAFYQTDEQGANYGASLPVVVAANVVDYGTAEGHAPCVQIIYLKQYVKEEKCDCFVRVEGGVPSVIVREAADLHLLVTLAADGRVGSIKVDYSPRTQDSRVIRATARERFLLRNLRIDCP